MDDGFQIQIVSNNGNGPKVTEGKIKGIEVCRGQPHPLNPLSEIVC